MPLPNNNLPSSSQQWAREIEKQLAALNQTAATNSANAVSTDAASLSNSANLSSLLLDQVELVSYASEMPGTRSNTFVGTGFQQLDTTKLTRTIDLNKERSAFISYSSSYDVNTDFLVNNLGYSWYIAVQLFVNNVRIGYTTVGKGRTINTGTNPYTQENETGQILFNKLVRLSPGSNTVSVRVDIGHAPATGSANITSRINVSDDDLSIDIIK